MEALLLIALVILSIVVFSIKTKIEEGFNGLRWKIDELKEELNRIKQRPAEVPISQEEKKVVLKEILKPIVPVPEVPPIQEEKPKIEIPLVVEPELIHVDDPTVEPEPVAAPTPPKPGFFERNPDLEKFIGENLANKIGIGILVLGVGFFVKYAIDQNWINEIGRVFIGILCGGILLGVAHRLRKTFNTFSSVLVGGGIAVLYLTITIAFQEYHIFSQTAAFIIMAIITGFTVLLALGYNKIELAILAILGGFGAPFMVSTGEGNYVVLFTYVLLLDVGMLALAYFKNWKPVTIISYGLTLLLFGSWLATKFNSEDVGMMRGALIFATCFYLTFFLMNIINNLKEKTPFKAFEFSLILSNTFLYYSAGMFILHNPSGMAFRGLFTALMGIFNFGFAYSLFKNKKADRNLVFLLIGLVLTFISLAAPIQLKGNYITLFWAAETVLLLWLSQKSGIKLMKIASILVMVLMIISLLMDWDKIYLTDSATTLNILFNKGYITSMFALGSLALTFYFLKNETDPIINLTFYKNVLTLIGVLVLYSSQLLELRYHVQNSSLDEATQAISIGIYNMIFLLGLLVTERKLPIPAVVRPWFAGVGVFAFMAHLMVYQPAIVDTRLSYLTLTSGFEGLGLHYIYLAILVAICILSVIRFRTLTEFNVNSHNAYAWFFVAFFVYLASSELDTHVLLAFSSNTDSISYLLAQNHKIGFPILWGLSSFILIAYGMKRKIKTVRIISLTLFFITLLKLFLVDIRGISEGGKIAAFISLGILLLIVSFMYQKLKKLLLADESKIKTETE